MDRAVHNKVVPGFPEDKGAAEECLGDRAFGMHPGFQGGRAESVLGGSCSNSAERRRSGFFARFLGSLGIEALLNQVQSLLVFLE